MQYADTTQDTTPEKMVYKARRKKKQKKNIQKKAKENREKQNKLSIRKIYR